MSTWTFDMGSLAHYKNKFHGLQQATSGRSPGHRPTHRSHTAMSLPRLLHSSFICNVQVYDVLPEDPCRRLKNSGDNTSCNRHDATLSMRGELSRNH